MPELRLRLQNSRAVLDQLLLFFSLRTPRMGEKAQRFTSELCRSGGHGIFKNDGKKLLSLLHGPEKACQESLEHTSRQQKEAPNYDQHACLEMPRKELRVRTASLARTFALG
jgi:hypothetical protein